MIKIGIIGWRGMVGSVLLEQHVEEKDFDLVAPTFFSTSQAGAAAPRIGAAAARNERRRPRRNGHAVVQDANDIAALAQLPDAHQHPGRRLHPGHPSSASRVGLAGLLDRCRLDAAHGTRTPVIVLDPVNLPVMQPARERASRISSAATARYR